MASQMDSWEKNVFDVITFENVFGNFPLENFNDSYLMFLACSACLRLFVIFFCTVFDVFLIFTKK